ncbi:hypothetical protein QE507_20530 [Escherichia coli]|nr:hypothetical protein [Escherichia coli]
MKYGITLLMLCLLAGCAQRNTQLPPVSGNPEPVNSPAIIQELAADHGFSLSDNDFQESRMMYFETMDEIRRDQE